MAAEIPIGDLCRSLAITGAVSVVTGVAFAAQAAAVHYPRANTLPLTPTYKLLYDGEPSPCRPLLHVYNALLAIKWREAVSEAHDPEADPTNLYTDFE